MNFAEARARLNEWTMLTDGKQASTNKSVQAGPLVEGAHEAWWQENNGTTPDWRNGRSVGYLYAYLELANGAIPMTGIQLDDGYMWPDRAVVRSMLASRCLVAAYDRFVPTELGRALVAPFLNIEDHSAVATFHSMRRSR